MLVNGRCQPSTEDVTVSSDDLRFLPFFVSASCNHPRQRNRGIEEDPAVSCSA